MLYKNSPKSKVLLTTPDYPPKLGGLSTLTKSIERSLQRIGVSYDVFVWENLKVLKNKEGINHEYPFIINIHFFGSHYLKSHGKNHINIIHGSEVLFTSPNLFKKWVKKALKPLFLASLQQSHLNLFISSFTQNLTENMGLKIDYGRDIILPNCINLNKSNFPQKSLSDEEISLICIARDVPHKNISASLELAEVLAQKLGREVTLYVTKDLPSRPFVKVQNISSVSDEERDALLGKAHFNLLLSLDHSHKGFVEGFGLTVLEAGLRGTPSIVSPYGGLPEACHHLKTGWVVKPLRGEFEKLFSNINERSYQAIRKTCYDHTLEHHDDRNYDAFFKSLFKNNLKPPSAKDSI